MSPLLWAIYAKKEEVINVRVVVIWMLLVATIVFAVPSVELLSVVRSMIREVGSRSVAHTVPDDFRNGDYEVVGTNVLMHDGVFIRYRTRSGEARIIADITDSDDVHPRDVALFPKAEGLVIALSARNPPVRILVTPREISELGLPNVAPILIHDQKRREPHGWRWFELVDSLVFGCVALLLWVAGRNRDSS